MNNPWKGLTSAQVVVKYLLLNYSQSAYKIYLWVESWKVNPRLRKILTFLEIKGEVDF